jgi:hypothetical protein
MPTDALAGLEMADGSKLAWPIPPETLHRKLSVPGQGRLYFVRYALKEGMPAGQVCALTGYDPWFVDQLAQLVEFEDTLLSFPSLEALPRESLLAAKQMGYSDAQLAQVYLGDITPDTVLAVRAHRKSLGIEPAFKLVDTCAAEFEAATPYYYSTYESGFSASPGAPIPIAKLARRREARSGSRVGQRAGASRAAISRGAPASAWRLIRWNSGASAAASASSSAVPGAGARASASVNSGPVSRRQPCAAAVARSICDFPTPAAPCSASLCSGQAPGRSSQASASALEDSSTRSAREDEGATASGRANWRGPAGSPGIQDPVLGGSR